MVILAKLYYDVHCPIILVRVSLSIVSESINFQQTKTRNNGGKRRKAISKLHGTMKLEHRNKEIGMEKTMDISFYIRLSSKFLRKARTEIFFLCFYIDKKTIFLIPLPK